MSTAYYPVLSDSKALPIALEGIRWLSESGSMPPGFLPNIQIAQAIVASSVGSVVGVILFVPKGETCCVELAYVEPSSRRMGYFREMLDLLRGHCRQEGLTRIEFVAAGDNAAAADAYEAVGADISHYVYQMDVV